MTYLQTIILGLAQGLSEFLPISSSGHLALLQYFFGVDAEQVLPFAVLLHLGTLISVFIVYWNDIVELVKELGDQRYFHGKGTSGQCQSNQTAWIHDHRGDHTDGDHRPGIQ